MSDWCTSSPTSSIRRKRYMQMIQPSLVHLTTMRTSVHTQPHMSSHPSRTPHSHIHLSPFRLYRLKGTHCLVLLTIGPGTLGIIIHTKQCPHTATRCIRQHVFTCWVPIQPQYVTALEDSPPTVSCTVTPRHLSP